jgi:hypothetical protein
VSIQEEVNSLKYQVRILQGIVIILILVLGAKAFGNDVQVAKADFRSVPVHIGKYYQYFSTAYVDPSEREQLEIAFRLTVPSLSRTVLLDAAIPQQLTPTLWKVNLKHLQWGNDFIKAIKKDYPYDKSSKGYRPLIIRADWFVQYALDNTKSDNLYQLLLFGRELKTEAAFLEFFKADVNSQFAYAFIEDDSGVALNKTRILQFAPTLQGQPITYTRDFKELNQDTDPLENLDRATPHDASEVIAALPKRIGQTGEMGLLQAYGLFDGNGDNVRNAPPDIVVDYAGARGPELRNAISCIACHNQGLLHPSVNALRRFNESGGLFGSADPQAAIKINERFNVSPKRQVDYWNESYRLAVEYCTGTTPEAASKAVQDSIKAYDRNVTFEQAARELRVTPRVLGRFIINLSQRTEKTGRPYLPARIVQLSKVPIRRELWEAHFMKLYVIRKNYL